MSIREQIGEMPGEKQIAWALRLIITVSILASGTVVWDGLKGMKETQAAQTKKLDGISETQAVQTVQLNRLLIDDTRRATRMDDLHELYYLLRDRIKALELRLDQRDKRDAPPER